MEFVVVVGTYEHILYGFYCLENDDSQQREAKGSAPQKELRLDPMFIYSSHLSGITALSVQEHLMASGSSDETVKIYDLKKRIEVGSLMQHNGAINAIEFYGSHMLSGGQDGTICIWENKHWECLVTLKAHKGGVIDFSVHPSGKVALSIGKDKSMKMWDLVKGKSAFKTRLVRAPQMVRWSPSGEVYCLVDETKLTIYTAADNTVVHTIESPKKIISLEFVTPKLVALGCEEGVLQCWNTDTGELTYDLVGHKFRVRGLSATNLPVLEDAVEGKKPNNVRHFLTSGSSEGVVKVWEIPELSEDQSLPITLKAPKAQVNVDARITSVASTLVFVQEGSEPEQASAGTPTATTPKKKRSRRRKKQEKKPNVKVIIDDEQENTEADTKKRKRGASPAPSKVGGGKPNKSNQNKQTQRDNKRQRMDDKKSNVQNEQKESRAKKRKQKEEEMIANAVFGDTNQKPKKKPVPVEQISKEQKKREQGQNHQLLNPGRPKKTAREGTQQPAGKKRGGKGGNKKKGQKGGAVQILDENFFLKD